MRDRLSAFIMTGCLAVTAGCMGGPLGPQVHYVTAKDIALISFDENVGQGSSIGSVRGGDCTWSFMGRSFGGAPTLDKALQNARQGRGESVSDALNGGLGTAQPSAVNVRYFTDVMTDRDGFNAGIVAKRCLIVKGMGHQ